MYRNCKIYVMLLAGLFYYALPASGNNQEQKQKRSNQEIQTVIRAGLPSIKRCYQNQLKLNPKLEGKIALTITILPKGTVEMVTVKENTTKSTDLAECVTEVVEAWKFKAIEEEVEEKISFTLPFAPTK